MKERVIIAGGGITGLSAAHFLRNKGFDPLVLETREEAGGNIRSQKEKGYTLENGPNTVLMNNAPVIELIDELNLKQEIFFPGETAGNRFILKGGKLNKLPSGPSGFFGTDLLSFRAKLRVLKEPFIKPQSNHHDESLADFSRRRFGQEAYENFIIPFVTGIYAGDPEQMSSRYALPMLYEAEQKYGSVIKGMIKKAKEKRKSGLPDSQMFSLKNGLQTLPEAIRSELGEKFIPGATIYSFEKKKNEYAVSYYRNGKKEHIHADRIIFTLPAYTMAKLIGSHSIELTNLLNAVRYNPIVSIHLGYDKSVVGDQKHQGFGVLTPAYENCNYLGVLFSSRIFPHVAPEGKELFTVMVGGARSPELTKMPEEKLVLLIRRELEELMKINGAPELTHLYKWEKAIPQYDLYHEHLRRGIDQFENEFRGIHLPGNYARGISVPDCVEKSYKLAEQIAG